MILRARPAGQVVLFDIDDDIWHFPPWNPAGRAMNNKAPNVKTADPETILLNMTACDAVIASTPALGASVIEVLNAEGCDTPVAVARAGVDRHDYPLPPYEERRHDGPLRVGWAGVWDYRGPDLLVVRDALAKVLPTHDAILWTCGATRPKVEADPEGMGFPKLAIELDYPPYVIRETNWRKLWDFPEWMAECDIAIIPQVDCQFNRARSCHSALQWAACGVPVLATRLPEYELLEDFGGCFTVAIDEWADELHAMLFSRGMRLIESREAYAAADCFSPEVVAEQYVHIVEGL
jgi:glycosyltransferase involved in cell wall biosynthesis